MWHAHLARDSRAGRPCHFAKLHHYQVNLLTGRRYRFGDSADDPDQKKNK
jgi:hypothetical protein